MARPSTLPVHPTTLVLAALRKSPQPLTAYELLKKLKKHGVQGPPVVYRALEKLAAEGSVHRIQALNAYVACNCAPSHTHDVSVLTVCQDCRKVDELHNHEVIRHLTKLRRMHVNLPDLAVVELPVTCDDCMPHKAG